MMLRQVGAVLRSLVAREAPVPAITGPEVLSRCEEAYRALLSYRGTTRVSQKHSRPGGAVRSTSTQARIWYMPPGKLRIEGTLTRDYGKIHPGTFDVASDGSQTFQRWTVEGNLWKKSDSVEHAVAAFTGVSRGACTTIPSLLFSMKDGRPWSRATHVQSDVVLERVGGVPAYRVTFADRFANTTVWVDPKTFLLLKLREVRDDDKLEEVLRGGFEAAQEELLSSTPWIPEDLRNAIIEKENKERKRGPQTTITTESFTNVRTTGTIPATVFEAIDLPNA